MLYPERVQAHIGKVQVSLNCFKSKTIFVNQAIRCCCVCVYQGEVVATALLHFGPFSCHVKPDGVILLHVPAS